MGPGPGLAVPATGDRPDPAAARGSSADGAAGVRRWWAEHALADAPWASRVVADLLAESTTLTDRRDCFLAVAVRVPRGSRLLDAAAVDAAEQHLAAITDALASAEVDVAGS